MPCMSRFALCGWTFCGCTDVVTFVEIRGLRSLLVLFHCVCPQGHASPFTDSITGTTNRKRSVKQFQHKTNPISRDCTTNAKHVFIARVLDSNIRVCVCLVSVFSHRHDRMIREASSRHTRQSVAPFLFSITNKVFMERFRKTRTHVTMPSLSTCPSGTHHLTQHMVLRLPWRVSLQMRCIKKENGHCNNRQKTKKNKTAVVVTAALFNMHSA